ncbi:MAG TPA: hypothetical protein VFB72_01500 [Verrucomicrobiae bacterium]|nr:hypothetical protein [Verrucomicrobiae bacterium]
MLAKRNIVVLGVLILIAIICFAFWNAKPGPPSLLFRGYAGLDTNGNQIARLELTNASHRTIWIPMGGRSQQQSAPVLMMWFLDNKGNLTSPHYPKNPFAYRLIGGKRLAPHESLALNCELSPAEPLQKIGIQYYTGHIRDQKDFIAEVRRQGTVTWVPALKAPTFKEKILTYWYDFKHRLAHFESHQTWCPDPISFQAASSSPPIHGRPHMAGKTRVEAGE